MLFNSYVFIFVFLPIVLFLWWLPVSTAARLIFLAAASYVFYAYWDLGAPTYATLPGGMQVRVTDGMRFSLLMMGTTVVDYAAGRAIHATQDPGRKKLWLILSLLYNLGMLGFFKYYDFFATSVNAVAHQLGAGSV